MKKKYSENVFQSVLKISARKFCAEPILNHVKMIGNRSSYDIFLFHHSFRISWKIMIWHDILTIDERRFCSKSYRKLFIIFLTIMKTPIKSLVFTIFANSHQKNIKKSLMFFLQSIYFVLVFFMVFHFFMKVIDTPPRRHYLSVFLLFLLTFL